MADEFKYDPEGEDRSAARTRLPFGICKAHGIKIEDWWTPRHAWEALKNHGIVKEVSEEYKEYYAELKRKRAKEKRKKDKERKKRINEQMQMSEHTPEINYTHQQGAIAGAKKGKPMSFKEADNGHVNPYFKTAFIGYKTNCATCCAVYFARRLGYNVRALPNLNNRNIAALSYQSNLAYLTPDGKHPVRIYKPSGERTINWVNRTLKEGEIYAISGRWKGDTRGHIITVEKANGQLHFYDPQSNTSYNSSQFMREMGSQWKEIRMINLTNCRIDERFCDSIMKEA